MAMAMSTGRDCIASNAQSASQLHRSTPCASNFLKVVLIYC